MKKGNTSEKMQNSGGAFSTAKVFVCKTFGNLRESFRKIRKLLKLLINNKYAIGSTRGFKKALINVLKSITIFGIVLLVLWFILSRIKVFLMIDINPQIFAIVLLVILIISLMSSIASIINNLFISKDNEILLSLPISASELFISKLIYLYINELVFNILYIGPVLVTFGIMARTGATPMNFLSFLLFFPIIPVATLGIGGLLSVPIMFVVRFFKDHNKTTIISGLLLLAALFLLYMFVITNVSGAFNVVDEQIKTSLEINGTVKKIGSQIPVLFWLSSAFFKGAHSIGRVFLFLIACLGIILVTGPFIKMFFQKIAVFNNETKKETRARARKYVKRSPERELFLNEFRTCLRSPNLIMQYFLFTILLPIIIYSYDKLLFTISVNQTGQSLLFASHVLVLMMLTCLSSTISSVAISRQGGLVYISKMIPISYEKQTTIKIAFNVIITWIAIIIGTVVSCIFSTANTTLLIVSAIAAMFLSIGHVCQSYDLDLRNPSIDWYDVSEISSLSKNTTTSILYGFLLALVFAAITVVANGKILLTSILLLSASILYAFGRFALIRVRLKYLFDEMEL